MRSLHCFGDLAGNMLRYFVGGVEKKFWHIFGNTSYAGEGKDATFVEIQRRRNVLWQNPKVQPKQQSKGRECFPAQLNVVRFRG